MITKEQALQLRHGDELHENGCTLTIGPRGAKRFRIATHRVNGACQTWKTRPDDFSIPLKYGFRGPYSYLTPSTAQFFHLPADCPLRAQEASGSN